MPAERAASETEAANGALAHIGEPPIVDLGADTTAARACAQRFGDVRDEALRLAPWNFASAWVQAPAGTANAVGRFGWRYLLPSDCVTVREVQGLFEDEWEVEGPAGPPPDHEQLASLLTNATAPNINYTRRVVDPRLWDATFLAAFQFLLAAALAPRLARDPGVAAALRANGEALALRAKRQDAREKARGAITLTPSWITARWT